MASVKQSKLKFGLMESSWCHLIL